jgi:hypothetical protein
MGQGDLPPREPGELEISAPVSVPHAPLQARTRVLLAVAALLAVASILGVTIPAAQRGLAAQRAQATQTAAAVRQVRAAYATETAYVRRAIASQTEVAQATAGAAATIAAASTTAYSATVPGCPLGDPLWQTSNFDPANPNYVCAPDGLQIQTGTRPHFGITFCAECQLTAHHDTQIHIFDISPNVGYLIFNDGLVLLYLHVDGTWQIYGQKGIVAIGTHPLPSEFTMRIRADGTQVTVWVNSALYANLPLTNDSSTMTASISLDIVARDPSQQASIRAKDFAFTPLP